MQKKDLKAAFVMLLLMVVCVFLVAYLVPIALVVLTHAQYLFYKAVFWWQLVIIGAQACYMAYTYAPNKEITNDTDETNHGSN